MTEQLETLIAEMKAAAENCTSMRADIDENMAYANFIAKVEPSTILALIAALEQAQQHNKELQVKLDATEAVALALRDDTRGAEKRIAELQASPLAVKLPKKNIGWDRDDDDCWNNAIDACAEAIRAAGGTVCEGE